MLSLALLILVFACMGWPGAARAEIPADLVPNGNWWRNCASLDLDFYNDRYYINHNTTCDGTVGTVYSGATYGTNIVNFINGAGATFTRAGTNVTATGAPFYLASNQSFVSRAVTTATYAAYLAPFYLNGSQSFVSRASTATYFNSSGVLSTAATNTARTNYTYNGSAWVNAGTLIEPASTNLIPQSSTYTGWNNNAQNGATNSLNQDTTAPDGTEAYSIVASNGGAGYFYIVPAASIVDTVPYTISTFVKTVSGASTVALGSDTACWGTGAQTALVYFNVLTGSFSYIGPGVTATSAQTIGNGWWRVSVTATPSSNCSGIAVLNYPQVTGSSEFAFWGNQFEQGSTATSYIPTSGSTVTRAADVYSTPFDGTYINASGVMQTATASVARDNHNYTSPYSDLGTLIEPAATNLVVSSTNLAYSSVWNGYCSSAAQGYVADPAGGMNAVQLPAGTRGTDSGGGCAGDNGLIQCYEPTCSTTPTPVGTYTVSFWGRTLSGTVAVQFGLDDAHVTSCTLTTSWQLCSATFTKTSTSEGDSYNDTYRLFEVTGPAGGSSFNSYQIFGPQVEATSYATSYIPTGTTTVTRNADVYANPAGGTYFNASGVMQSAAPNTPRLDHNPASPYNPLGILIEGSAKNLVPYSATYGASGCGTGGSGTTNDDTTAPDGTTAYSFINSSGGHGGCYTIETVSPSTTYTLSTFVKAVSGSDTVELGSDTGGCWVSGSSTSGAAFTFNTVTGAFSGVPASVTRYSAQTIGNGWWRVSSTATTSSSCTSASQVNYVFSTSAETAFWGNQFEAGGFPTSYIPTSGSAVTRAADVFTLPTTAGGGSGWLTQGVGTLGAAGELLYAATFSQNLADLTDGTGQNSIALCLSDQYAGSKVGISYGGSTVYGDFSYLHGKYYAAGTVSKGVIAYQASSQNAAFAATLFTPGTASTMPTTVSNLYIGSIVSGAALNGYVNRIWYMPTRQPDATLDDYTR